MRFLPSAARAALAAVAVAAIFVPCEAAAQVLRIPERAAERTEPPSEQLQQRAVFGLDLLGGYDDSITGDTSTVPSPGAPPLVTESGYLGVADVSLLYSRSRGTTQMSLDSRAGITTTTSSELGPSERASVAFNGSTQWGRNTTARFGSSVQYDSLYTPGEFGPVDVEVPVNELPTSTTLSGLLQRTSWANTTTLGLDQRVGRRGSAGVTYTFDYRDFINESDPSSHTHGVSASYDHRFNRSAVLSGSYDYSQGEFVGGVQVLDQRPLTTHTFEAGPQITKRFSPRRSLIMDFGAGATRVDTLSGPDQVLSQFWSSYGHASARIDLDRTWTLSGNFERTANPLDGFTTETYISNTFAAAVGGNVGSRTQLTFSGGVATGNVASTAAVASNYKSYLGAVQLGFRIVRNMSAIVNYGYYKYNFTGDDVLPGGVPSEFSRNAVRVGLSYSLPLTRESRASRP
jgi:hypothetical protein